MTDTPSENPNPQTPARRADAALAARREAAADRLAFEEWLGAIDVGPEPDPMLAILERIMAAGGIEDLPGIANTLPWKLALGRPFEVIDWRDRESDYDQGLARYMLVDAIDLETGEKVTLSTGAANVMAFLFVAKRRGWLPVQMQVVEASRPTEKGFKPLWPMPVPAGRVTP